MNVINHKVFEKVNTGNLHIWWLGQSGYLLKDSSNTTILIDPYITDTISKGYRPYIHSRLIPPVLNPDIKLNIDGVFLTHDHQDHLDPNSIVMLAKHHDPTFLGPSSVCDKLVDVLDVKQEKVINLNNGVKNKLGSFSVEAVKAVHSIEAVGFIVNIENLTLYFSGDTVLFLGMEDIGKNHEIDIAFLCINGQQNNMDISSASFAAEMVGAKNVIPNHYGMYADNTEDPGKFAHYLHSNYPQIKCKILEAGNGYKLYKEKNKCMITNLRNHF